jgi:ketosteroid isomerase-like protein
MTLDTTALQRLIDKDAIRDLVLGYSRAIDRKDIALLRDLYTVDATDSHGDSFDGGAKEYCDFIERALPHMPYSGHHVCNHLISVDGDEGNGEVYALAYHLIPDREHPGGFIEDFMCVRYIDRYRREADGQWRFAKRVVTYDVQTKRPFDGKFRNMLERIDPSYEVCSQRAFQKGPRR